jgi:cobalt-zinc-cadmium efflux system outer membrane protein
VRAAELARDEAALRRRVEQVGVLGDWQLQGGTKLTGGFMTGQIGLAVPLPMFNHNSGGRERAREAERDADAAYRTAMLQVVAEAAVAEQQRQRLEALRDRFSDASYGRVIAESARIAYAEGAMTLLELLDAERAAADAQLLSQQYAADALRAQLVLARAVGISLVSMSSGALGALP